MLDINTSHPDFLGSADGNLLRDGVKNIGYTPPKKKDPEPPASGGGGIFSILFGNKEKPATPAAEKPNPRRTYEDVNHSFFLFKEAYAHLFSFKVNGIFCN